MYCCMFNFKDKNRQLDRGIVIWLELVNLNLHPGVTGISLWLQSNLIIRRRMRSIKMNWYVNERDILKI